MRIMRVVSILLVLVSACGKAENDRSGDPGAATSSGPPAEAPPTGTGTATSITVADLISTALYTSDTAANSCIPITIKTLKDGAPIGDVAVAFSISPSNVMQDKGTVTPIATVSDAGGDLTVNYCSGKDEGSVTVVVKAGGISSNSAKITISKKAVFEFAYVRSDLDGIVTNVEGDKLLTLNTLDSGPSDCTNIYFKLSKSGAPVVGEKLVFGTQVDFPKGSKLGKKTEPLTTLSDPITNKKYAVYTSISSGSGEFAVPVCAGVTLGSLIVSATYTDTSENRVYHVTSPVIRITSGLTNYTTFSLTFDKDNARTLKGYYNTNSEFDLALTIQLGARFDGRALPDYPLIFATEVGRYTLDKGGVADAETGTVKATLHALHLVDNYPYPIINFGFGFSPAQTRCEPASIAAWAQAQGLPSLKYKDLRRNWQSTAVYAVRGQEYFNDADRNGIYNEGGDGFWDKNQNGVYDAGDELTYDAGANGFDPTGEWFIDLPTPFVDVDDDKVFTLNKDYLLGDEYTAPNGKRDADALIWKSEVFPISMGPSHFGLMSQEILAGNGYLTNPLRDFENGYVWGRKNIDESLLWPGGATDYLLGSQVMLAFFAHDICGNLLAGGTKISIDYVELHKPVWGDRSPTAHIYTQPDDFFFEPTRRMLSVATGSPEATINFNGIDHPSNAKSYPIYTYTETPPCSNVCSGAVIAANPGLSCDGWAGRIRLNVTEPDLDQHGSGTTIENNLSWPAVETCNCINPAPPNFIIQDKGVCRCLDPADNWDGTSCSH